MAQAQTNHSRKHLATYLNDHLGGATAGVELAGSAASRNEGTPVGSFLAELRDEIDADRPRLINLIAGLGME